MRRDLDSLFKELRRKYKYWDISKRCIQVGRENHCWCTIRGDDGMRLLCETGATPSEAIAKALKAAEGEK